MVPMGNQMDINTSSSSSMYENDDDDNDEDIPRDVPKGHLVVYVGENQSRFVINVKLLKKPLVQGIAG
ncbi:hypothetical protein M8C21_023446 [Ambrosia artemisiifolia]|uniref:Uncharacterized protein n=1 Tax=Ambrosia artemisiifolia TaxID=4212 RepID=A0AAD5D0N8_AMBAR|nr:hypothetical protein M8C21_023446 [Ambrosia artemisiifolia]